MAGDRNAVIGIDTICFDNPRENKPATSLLKQKYFYHQTIPHILNLIAQNTLKNLYECVNNIFKVILFVKSHDMAQVRRK